MLAYILCWKNELPVEGCGCVWVFAVEQALFIKFVGTHKQYDAIDVGSL